MLSIQKKLIKYNFSNGNNIRYIVIHDTANTAKGADAEAHYRYFNGGDRGASAHYFVDDHSILQLVEDTNAAWHVGDGKGKYGITNHNSIGIEICINADGDYDKAVANAIDLTKYLMNKYNIPIDRVVRHYDASRKLCPRSMSANNWAKWNWFKQQLISKPVPSRSEPERPIVQPVSKTQESEVFEMEYGVVIGSMIDYPAAEPVAVKYQAPIFIVSALGNIDKCKNIILCGGDIGAVRAKAPKANIINLSGNNRYNTAANIAKFLGA